MYLVVLIPPPITIGIDNSGQIMVSVQFAVLIPPPIAIRMDNSGQIIVSVQMCHVDTNTDHHSQ